MLEKIVSQKESITIFAADKSILLIPTNTLYNVRNHR